MRELWERDGLVAVFDEDMWYALIENVTVENKGRFSFLFKSGESIAIDF